MTPFTSWIPIYTPSSHLLPTATGSAVGQTRPPHVSIIVPVYNSVSTLLETLESIYAQDYTDWELIIFDDGSCDGTQAVVRETVAERRESIRFLEHEGGKNRGPAATRNRAVEQARGEVIAFLDADDLWLPGKLTEHVKWMECHPQAAMLWGPAEYFGEQIESYKQPTNVDGEQVFYEPPAMAEVFIRSKRATPIPSGMLIRRGAFLAVGGFEEELRRGEDISLCVKIAGRYPVLYDDRIWFRYRRHLESSTARSSRDGSMESWEMEFHLWLMHFVYREASLRHLRWVAEDGYHSAIQKWAAQSGWWRGRWELSRQIVRFPGLLRWRWWRVLAYWIFPPGSVSRSLLSAVRSRVRHWSGARDRRGTRLGGLS